MDTQLNENEKGFAPKSRRGRPVSKNPKNRSITIRFTEDEFSVLTSCLDELAKDGETRSECMARHLAGFVGWSVKQKHKKELQIIERMFENSSRSERPASESSRN